jgi:transcriptional regulator with XRE-family HTH domain
MCQGFPQFFLSLFLLWVRLSNVASWGESLKDRREAAGMSADQLGAKAGVSGETVRRIERGENPSSLTRRKIDDALERGSDADRLSRLEREMVQLRQELAALVELAERLAGPQVSRPASRPTGPQRR